MRIRPFTLGALTILLLGATDPAGCNINWLALLNLIAPTNATLSVHVINKAYQPVQFSLITSSVTNAADTPAATQPADGGSTLERDGQYDTTFPCTSLPEVLACKATLVVSGGTGKSATSETLHKDTDYSCGSDVTFTVRPIAGAGIVVGAQAD
jgi:hypothetical protein